MQQLLISSRKLGDPSYLKHYIKSFPGHVPDVVEQYMKEENQLSWPLKKKERVVFDLGVLWYQSQMLE